MPHLDWVQSHILGDTAVQATYNSSHVGAVAKAVFCGAVYPVSSERREASDNTAVIQGQSGLPYKALTPCDTCGRGDDMHFGDK